MKLYDEELVFFFFKSWTASECKFAFDAENE